VIPLILRKNRDYLEDIGIATPRIGRKPPNFLTAPLDDALIKYFKAIDAARKNLRIDKSLIRFINPDRKVRSNEAKVSIEYNHYEFYGTIDVHLRIPQENKPPRMGLSGEIRINDRHFNAYNSDILQNPNIYKECAIDIINYNMQKIAKKNNMPNLKISPINFITHINIMPGLIKDTWTPEETESCIEILIQSQIDIVDIFGNAQSSDPQYQGLISIVKDWRNTQQKYRSSVHDLRERNESAREHLCDLLNEGAIF
jgi:hypothetical protein